MDLIDRLREYASTRKGELAELITEAADTLERQTCEDAVSRADVVDMLEMYPFTEYSEYEAAREVVKRLPSVQPQITHCAECIHWKHSDVRKNYCEVFDWMNKAEDFCSFAERKDGD